PSGLLPVPGKYYPPSEVSSPMRTLTALILTAALAVPAFAQRQRPGGGGFGGFGGGPLMLARGDVQEELKPTDEPQTQGKEFNDKQAAARREAFGGGGQPDPEKMREMMTKMREESTKFLKDTLTEDQNKRLKQLTLQQSLRMNPAMAFFTPSFEGGQFALGEA